MEIGKEIVDYFLEELGKENKMKVGKTVYVIV